MTSKLWTKEIELGGIIMREIDDYISRDIIFEDLKQENQGLIIKRADMNDFEVSRLIDELSNELQIITGNGGQGSFDVSDMKNPRSIFAIAIEGNLLVGCGALREISCDTAEIKRMYARKKSCGIGGKLLSYLEEQARGFGYIRLVLETRKCNEKAVAFYLNHGYNVINNYGKYVDLPEAICFEKRLEQEVIT